MMCRHPLDRRVWDHGTGEVICGVCGEVVDVELALAPSIRHNPKLEGYLSLTELNTGTLPPSWRGRTEIILANDVAKYCSRLMLPGFIVKEAVAYAIRILRHARGRPYRVTLQEAAAAGIICACRSSRHPYMIGELAQVIGIPGNDIYRILTRISRFYDLPRGIVDAERYILAVTGRLEGEVEPYYLSLVERYAIAILRRGGGESSSPICRAAAAVAAADRRMAGRIGDDRIAGIAGLGVNGSFRRLLRLFEGSDVPPPVEAMEYVIQAFWEGLEWRG